MTVAKLRDAGAVILGKTTLPDFATSWFSFSSLSEETKNPFDPGRDPGGSSAGTGAAIAANLAAVGIGTDCGGSIRLPSSFCGLVGIRSTPGVVPRTGSSYLVIFQDTIGPMTRSWPTPSPCSTCSPATTSPIPTPPPTRSRGPPPATARCSTTPRCKVPGWASW